MAKSCKNHPFLWDRGHRHQWVRLPRGRGQKEWAFRVTRPIAYLQWDTVIVRWLNYC